MSTDTTPAARPVPAAPVVLPPELAEPAPRPAPVPDAAPKATPSRPTTRAGRRAAAEAKGIKKSGRADSKPASKPTPRKASLETRLTGSLTTLGVTVSMAGGMVSPAFTADGVLICEHAESVAKALAKVAQDQPHVAVALERMLTAGVYSGLVAAMLPLAVGIAANHGAIPPHLAQLLGGAPASE